MAAVESGRLDLPLPGSGRTWERFAAFADLAEENLSLARLGEGHAEPGRAGRARRRSRAAAGGVWAANPPGPNVTASDHGGRWVLRGTKQYCSGARVCTHALVTAATGDEARLFAVAAADLEPHEGTWPATGCSSAR